MVDQPTVTRGTAISTSAGTGATVAIGAETVQWIWNRAVSGAWEPMPVSTAALIATLATGVLSLVVYLIYWALTKRGVMFPEKPQ